MVRDWACHIFDAESLRKARKIVKFCIEMRTAFKEQNRWENILKKSGGEIVVSCRACHNFGAESLRKVHKF